MQYMPIQEEKEMDLPPVFNFPGLRRAPLNEIMSLLKAKARTSHLIIHITLQYGRVTRQRRIEPAICFESLTRSEVAKACSVGAQFLAYPCYPAHPISGYVNYTGQAGPDHHHALFGSEKKRIQPRSSAFGQVHSPCYGLPLSQFQTDLDDDLDGLACRV